MPAKIDYTEAQIDGMTAYYLNGYTYVAIGERFGCSGETAKRNIDAEAREQARVYASQRTPTYISWDSMKDRCLNPNHLAYDRYAGRGITVCDRWLGKDGFANFLADLGERPEGLSLDRIDNDLGYFPGNCKWSTRSEQNLNRRDRRAMACV